MSKELEALKIGIPKLKKLYENNAKKMSKNDILGFDLTFAYLDKALQYLEAIDNAKPNEALNYINSFLNEMTYCLEHPKEYAKGYEKEIFYKYRFTFETTIKQALQRLEQIDNSNPSQALVYIDAFIEENNNDIKNQDITGFDIDTQAKWVKYLEHKSFMLSTIKATLLKAQEMEKVLKIVFRKRIDLESFYTTFVENNYDYNYYEEMYGTYGKYKLTQEEFDLLKRYLCQSE